MKDMVKYLKFQLNFVQSVCVYVNSVSSLDGSSVCSDLLALTFTNHVIEVPISVATSDKC
jgi:hypothetical protein